MKEKKIIKNNQFIKYLNKSKYSIIIIIAIILLAFGERIISQSFSIDTEIYITEIGSATRWNWLIGLNRWGLVLLNNIFQMNSLPIFASNFITTILMILYSIIFNYLFYKYIKNEYKESFIKFQFIFPAIFVTNPIFAEQYNFILQNISVAFTIFLIPIIILIIDKAYSVEKKLNKIALYILTIIMLSISFGVYQSVILLYIVTVVACYFLKVLKEGDNSWKYLGKQISLFLTSAILYLIICKLLSGENSTYLQSSWKNESIYMCMRNIINAIIPIIKGEGIFYNLGYLLSCISIFAFLIYIIIKKKIKIGILISVVGLLLAPFYIMIITGADQFKRTQFNYSFVIGFILMFSIIVLSQKEKLKIIRNAFILISVIIIYNQSYTTANLFHTADMIYNNDVYFAHDLMYKIEEKEWYNCNEDYTLIFIGEYKKEHKNVYIKGEVIGASFFDFDYEYIYGVNSRANCFLNSLGYKFKQPTIQEFEDSKKYIESNQIKPWPNSESIILKDNNKIIVRLSEEY